MQENSFVKAKTYLLQVLYSQLNNTPDSAKEHHEILKVIQIVNEYTYTNRLRKKGSLTRIIIDSLNLDYALGDVIIDFDYRIS